MKFPVVIQNCTTFQIDALASKQQNISISCRRNENIFSTIMYNEGYKQLYKQEENTI